jgi:hypothetical protein
MLWETRFYGFIIIIIISHSTSLYFLSYKIYMLSTRAIIVNDDLKGRESRCDLRFGTKLSFIWMD